MISDWLEFQPLPKETFVACFSEYVGAEECFDEWMDGYEIKEINFYRSLIDQFLRSQWYYFCQHCGFHSLALEDFDRLDDPDYFRHAWQEVKFVWGIPDHLAFVQELNKKHRFNRAARRKDRSGYLDVTKLETFMCGNWVEQANGLWFALNNPSPAKEEIDRLRSLPYPDYLQTSHWRRIRASVILIQSAHCGVCCESFYGGGYEADLHVHHHHYRNLGCERYEDLKLLCKVHHHRLHQELADAKTHG